MVRGAYRAEGSKGEKKRDNCNNIINKIYFKKELVSHNSLLSKL